MSSLLKTYEGFVDTILCGRTSFALEAIKPSLCSKEIQKHTEDLDIDTEECLMAWFEKKNDKKKKKNKNYFENED